MKAARFWFDEDLRRLLRPLRHPAEFDYTFNGPQSAKHLIESVGIPHTEIGYLHANEEDVEPGYLVQDGDRIRVFGSAASGSLAHEPHFVIDGHLGRLNSHLRMLGLDCIYQSAYDDELLLSIALGESRILLTRDRRLLMHKTLTHGYLLRSTDSELQLHEVVWRFSLSAWIRPFQRCIRCDHMLVPARKEDILERLEPLTKRYFEEFKICPACNQIYWKGSHFDRMQRLIAGLQT